MKLLRPNDIWNVVTQRNLEITGKSDNDSILLQNRINSIIDQDNGKYFHFVYDPTPEKNILMIYYQNPEMKELYQRHIFYVKIQLKLNPILERSMVMSQWYHPHQYAFEFVNNGQMIHWLQLKVQRSQTYFQQNHV